jgi:polynucleotide 5'-kinase involved in rRNA processing
MSINNNVNTILELLSKNPTYIISIYTENMKLFIVINYENRIYYYDNDNISSINEISSYLIHFDKKLFESNKIVCITCNSNNLSDVIYGNVNDIPLIN